MVMCEHWKGEEVVKEAARKDPARTRGTHWLPKSRLPKMEILIQGNMSEAAKIWTYFPAWLDKMQIRHLLWLLHFIIFQNSGAALW